MQSQLSRYRPLLRAYVLPRWRLAGLLLVLLLTTIGLELLSPQLVRIFIDDATARKDVGILTTIAVIFTVVAIATQIVSVAETYVAENLGWLATNRLRADLCLHCLRLDPGFHHTHPPGALIERIDGDVTDLSNFFSRFVVYVFGNGVLVVGVLIMLCAIDLRLGAAITAFTIVAVVVIWRMQGIAVPHWTRSRQASAAFFGFLEERLAGTEDLRSCGAVAFTMRQLYGHARDLLRTQRRASVMGSTIGGTMFFLFWGGMAIALALGAYLYQHAGASIGTVYLIFNYTQMLNRPIEELTRQLQDFQQAAGSVVRIQQLLAVEGALQDGAEPFPATALLPVTFEHVTFAYDDEGPVLHDVSFAVGAGKVLGVLGRTGSGKTTLSRLLFRLYDPQTGAIRLDGRDLRAVRLADLRKHIGMVTQEIQLFHATVRDNLTFFDPDVADEQIERVLVDLGLRDWLQELPQGLETVLSARGMGLSAGEAQLLAFARVFLADPAVVVLDEASSRLDPATERRIEQAVDRLLANRTGIVIAHRLGTLARADDILVLDGGRVLESGSRANLAADATSHFARLLQAGLTEVLV